MHKVPNFRGYVTLPASGDGWGISTVTKEEKRIPKAEWDETRKRGIVLLSEDYKILKTAIKQNCSLQQCTQLTGYFDELFMAIDQALLKVPLE